LLHLYLHPLELEDPLPLEVKFLTGLGPLYLVACCHSLDELLHIGNTSASNLKLGLQVAHTLELVLNLTMLEVKLLYRLMETNELLRFLEFLVLLDYLLLIGLERAHLRHQELVLSLKVLNRFEVRLVLTLKDADRMLELCERWLLRQ
jgi:hypothetical protein